MNAERIVSAANWLLKPERLYPVSIQIHNVSEQLFTYGSCSVLSFVVLQVWRTCNVIPLVALYQDSGQGT